MKTFVSISDGIKYFLDSHDETRIEMDTGYGIWLRDFENGTFSGVIFKLKERDTRLDFCPKDLGCVYIEQIRVDESKQRRGIGGQLFSLLLRIIRELNENGYQIDGKKIEKISGALCPYEYPLDQYDKSVPFYLAMASKFDIEFQIYRKDKSYKLNPVHPSEYEDFITDMPEGYFEFLL